MEGFTATYSRITCNWLYVEWIKLHSLSHWSASSPVLEFVKCECNRHIGRSAVSQMQSNPHIDTHTYTEQIWKTEREEVPKPLIQTRLKHDFSPCLKLSVEVMLRDYRTLQMQEPIKLSIQRTQPITQIWCLNHNIQSVESALNTLTTRQALHRRHIPDTHTQIDPKI